MLRADNLTTFMCWLSWNMGVSNSWNPQGWSGPVMGWLYLGYSHTEWCYVKYGTSFHRQSFVVHTYTACLALEHTVPTGSQFSTKVCLVKCYWLSFCLTWHGWSWSMLVSIYQQTWHNILNSLFISFLLQCTQFFSLTQTDCTNLTLDIHISYFIFIHLL